MAQGPARQRLNDRQEFDIGGIRPRFEGRYLQMTAQVGRPYGREVRDHGLRHAVHGERHSGALVPFVWRFEAATETIAMAGIGQRISVPVHWEKLQESAPSPRKSASSRKCSNILTNLGLMPTSSSAQPDSSENI